MKRLNKLVSLFAFPLFSIASLSSQAAIFEVDSLEVESLTFAVSWLGFSTSQTVEYDPAAVWIMGEYQGEVASGSIDTGTPGTLNYVIESTGAYGDLPSSGAVDTSLGTIDLNLSDLHMSISGNYSGEVDLWNIVSSTIDSNSYNGSIGDFIYGWSDTATIEYGLGGVPLDIDYSIEIAGVASVVPIPAAAWLFGSALLGLGVVKRRKA